MKKIVVFMAMLLGIAGYSFAQNPWNGKVVLQGFWWDYWNNNYPNGWSNYVAELAPRLKAMGIDAVWIPPSYKNNSPGSVGYSPFDHYDLGDKYQKGNLKTRMGDKDELLRMVAILHANGIEVISDIVLNHVDNAGSSTGAGGQDAYANANYNDWSTSGYKNFRYSSYATPATDESASDYLNRSGRWSKNWENFYPNQYNACCNNDLNSVYWGPDISYESNAYGQSSCTSCYNPSQSADYMKNNARDWLVWYKKQTGVDGFRFDAVKHFPTYVMEDVLWNTQYNAGFANGGWEMYAVGEYVGGASQLDDWANATQNRAGTFDFGLRDGLYGMVYGLGNYDMSNIPGLQQSNRTRTVPFVNNHDTYRPIVDANGNYAGWNTGDELAPHIHPDEPRMEAAHALAFAVDGSPMVFFEDLFDIDGTNRYSHDPTNSTDLPTRGAVQNIIWCHQKLDFKAGAYKVRHSGADHLVIERSGKAIIGVNDNWSSWQSQWIPTDFAPGTQLHDYSGANASDIWVDGNGWVQIWTPPCNGSNIRRGYTIWGPAGVSGGFSPAAITTSQEWQLFDDLGDSHAQSLGQGGAIPSNSIATRTAGRVFSTSGNIEVNLYPEDDTESLTLIVANSDGTTHLDSVSGTGTLTLNYSSTSTDYYTLKVRNTVVSNTGQNAWVKATYNAPEVVNTSSYKNALSIDQKQEFETELTLYPNPANEVLNLIWNSDYKSESQISVYSIDGRLVDRMNYHSASAYNQSFSYNIEDLKSGIYFIQIIEGDNIRKAKFIKE